MNLRKTLRKTILPLKDILDCFQGMKFENALDIGAGTGLFLELLYNHGIIKRGIGVETNPHYFRKINDQLAIIGVEEINGKQFDLILFNDVLHHIENKKEFIRRYAASYLISGGYVFIKEMDNRNILYKYFSRFHDLIIAGEFIHEISPKEVKEILINYEVAIQGGKRIFLYDHYWILLKKRDSIV
jgi:2-polyprenyl-3-methyl-5-hydroxy-6-metoxy-1,4-benzoquinol methylase